MIDPRRLRVLQALADHGTVTAAAKALYLSPSAVSQQLTSLESEVGHVLLERHGRRVRLTASGDLLVAHAHAIASRLERAEADLAAHASGTAGTITIAAYATAIATIVAPASAEISRRAPAVSVRVIDAEGNASLPMVLGGEVDIAVAVEYRNAPKPDDPRVYRRDLFAEAFDVVLPAGHLLADRSEVALADLTDSAWITTSPENPVHDVVQRACEHAGFSPQAHHRSDNFRAIVALVTAGAGVSLAPRSALHGLASPAVAIRPVAGTPPLRRTFAALRRGREAHPLAKLTLDALAAAAPKPPVRAMEM